MASSPRPAQSTNAKKEEQDKPLIDSLNVKFSPEEEAELVSESNAHKTEANNLFSSKEYDNALAKYDEAVTVCPNYLDYELAVLKSNIAACHLKLEEWKEAVSSSTAAIDGLDHLEKTEAEEHDVGGAGEDGAAAEEEVEEEIVSVGASKAGPALGKEETSAETTARKRKEDILRIKAKALMRRGRARSELGGWSNLAGAEEDYKALASMGNLSSADRKIILVQLKTLPARTKAAQEKETAEMWGKLKDLGNGILKPFGLSTENFKMVQDEKSGGYSMNFKPNDGK